MPKTPSRFNIPELILKLAFTRRLKEIPCSHLDQIQVREPDLKLEFARIVSNWATRGQICACA